MEMKYRAPDGVARICSFAVPSGTSLASLCVFTVSLPMGKERGARRAQPFRADSSMVHTKHLGDNTSIFRRSTSGIAIRHFGG
jgi:hypothetical protein